MKKIFFTFFVFFINFNLFSEAELKFIGVPRSENLDKSAPKEGGSGGVFVSTSSVSSMLGPVNFQQGDSSYQNIQKYSYGSSSNTNFPAAQNNLVMGKYYPRTTTNLKR